MLFIPLEQPKKTQSLIWCNFYIFSDIAKELAYIIKFSKIFFGKRKLLRIITVLIFTLFYNSIGTTTSNKL